MITVSFTEIVHIFAMIFFKIVFCKFLECGKGLNRVEINMSKSGLLLLNEKFACMRDREWGRGSGIKDICNYSKISRPYISVSTYST